MKRHYYALGAALLAGGVLLAGFGAYLKQRLPEETVFLYQEHSLIALPFGLLADGKLDDVLIRPTVDIMETTAPTAESVPDTVPADTADTVITQESTQQTTAPELDMIESQPATEETTAPFEVTEPPEPSVSLEELYPVIPEAVVEPEYFDDALFIGDSRMCGLRDYARLGDADYFCEVGMTIFNMWETKCRDYDFGSTLLADRLKRVKYGKIYVALGINECGFPVKNFMDEYERMIGKLRELQPEATIVLQGIMGVTREYAGSKSYFQPDHIAMLNEFISSQSDGIQVFCIDPTGVFTDPDGFLMTSITKDGCHLIAKENSLWARWLQSCPPIS